MYETSQLVSAYRDECEDRVAVFSKTDRLIIVVADGAGGVGSGGAAAETVVNEVSAASDDCCSPAEWCNLLTQIDTRIGIGESTAAVVDLTPERIVGASVGDSAAWLLSDGHIHDLTQRQKHKPLLGSGDAIPTGFQHRPLAPTELLLVSTDGFSKYARRDKLSAQLYPAEFYSVPRICIDSVRLKSGDLWDDVGVVACRLTPITRSRRRYEI